MEPHVEANSMNPLGHPYGRSGYDTPRYPPLPYSSDNGSSSRTYDGPGTHISSLLERDTPSFADTASASFDVSTNHTTPGKLISNFDTSSAVALMTYLTTLAPGGRAQPQSISREALDRIREEVLAHNMRRRNARHNISRRAFESDEDEDEGDGQPHSPRSDFMILRQRQQEQRRLDRAMDLHAIHTRKAASRDFIASLKKVDPNDLDPEKRCKLEQTYLHIGRSSNLSSACDVCYETFGEESPEGIVEHAVRLPKCKHVFGNLCLKKWLGDKATCPICRDSLFPPVET